MSGDDTGVVERVVLLIETGRKQGYIFDTSKRLEAVGASRLVVLATTEWVDGALSGLPAGVSLSPLVRAAGTFLAVVDGVGAENAALNVLRKVTTRAVKQAPGLEVFGVVEMVGPRSTVQGTVRRAFNSAEGCRSRRPAAVTEHLVDPFAALCATSGRPAGGMFEGGLRSAESLAKLAAGRELAGSLAAQLADVDDRDQPDVRFWTDTIRRASAYLADEATGPSRVTVIHADGNGIGEVVQKLGVGESDEDFTHYSEFSAALDVASVTAFVRAYRALLERPDRTREPVVLPLVLGGDDLTVVCDHRDALPFTREYLKAFQTAIGQSTVLGRALEKVTGHPTIGVAAGIADVGAHFPFMAAYELAEELCQEAKAVKVRLPDVKGRAIPTSAWSMHVHLDGTALSLREIRRRQFIKRNGSATLLTGAPWIERNASTSPEGLGSAAGALSWWNRHDAARVLEAAMLLQTRDNEGRRLLPATQVNRLRSTLLVDPVAADHDFRALAEAEASWVGLATDPGAAHARRSLTDGATGALPASARLLDAMALDGRL